MQVVTRLLVTHKEVCCVGYLGMSLFSSIVFKKFLLSTFQTNIVIKIPANLKYFFIIFTALLNAVYTITIAIDLIGIIQYRPKLSFQIFFHNYCTTSVAISFLWMYASNMQGT